MHYVAMLRTPCTYFLSVLGALNPYGNWSEEITAFIRQASPAAQAYWIHAHSAINNIYDGLVPQQHAGQVIAGKSSFKF
jgi:hypothetical protein